jgi:hypothetical protein
VKDKTKIKMMRKFTTVSMFEAAIETSHDDVQVVFKRVQVMESAWIDLADETWIQIGWQHGFRTNRQDSTSNGNVHVCCLLGDAVKEKKNVFMQQMHVEMELTWMERWDCQS